MWTAFLHSLKRRDSTTTTCSVGCSWRDSYAAFWLLCYRSDFKLLYLLLSSQRGLQDLPFGSEDEGASVLSILLEHFRFILTALQRKQAATRTQVDLRLHELREVFSETPTMAVIPDDSTSSPDEEQFFRYKTKSKERRGLDGTPRRAGLPPVAPQRKTMPPTTTIPALVPPAAVPPSSSGGAGVRGSSPSMAAAALVGAGATPRRGAARDESADARPAGALTRIVGGRAVNVNRLNLAPLALDRCPSSMLRDASRQRYMSPAAGRASMSPAMVPRAAGGSARGMIEGTSAGGSFLQTPDGTPCSAAGSLAVVRRRNSSQDGVTMTQARSCFLDSAVGSARSAGGGAIASLGAEITDSARTLTGRANIKLSVLDEDEDEIFTLAAGVAREFFATNMDLVSSVNAAITECPPQMNTAARQTLNFSTGAGAGGGLRVGGGWREGGGVPATGHYSSTNKTTSHEDAALIPTREMLLHAETRNRAAEFVGCGLSGFQEGGKNDSLSESVFSDIGLPDPAGSPCLMNWSELDALDVPALCALKRQCSGLLSFVLATELSRLGAPPVASETAPQDSSIPLELVFFVLSNQISGDGRIGIKADLCMAKLYTVLGGRSSILQQPIELADASTLRCCWQLLKLHVRQMHEARQQMDHAPDRFLDLLKSYGESLLRVWAANEQKSLAGNLPNFVFGGLEVPWKALLYRIGHVCFLIGRYVSGFAKNNCIPQQHHCNSLFHHASDNPRRVPSIFFLQSSM